MRIYYTFALAHVEFQFISLSTPTHTHNMCVKHQLLFYYCVLLSDCQPIIIQVEVMGYVLGTTESESESGIERGNEIEIQTREAEEREKREAKKKLEDWSNISTRIST